MASQDLWQTESIRLDDPRPAHPEVEQLMQLARSVQTPAHLFVAVKNQARLEVGVLMIPQPGGNGMVLTSPPLGREGVDRLAELLKTCCQSTDIEQVQLIQALIEPGHKRMHAALAQSGFWKLARLCYLQAPIPSQPSPASLPPNSRLVPYEPCQKNLFIEALSASYRGTLDCPKLHGLRSTDQAFASHRTTGSFDPNLWHLLMVENRIAGVILLNPVPSIQGVELVYLGLSPERRGHRLGSALLQHGFEVACAAGYRTMVLAVDEANTPAVRLYKHFGFSQTGIKDAFIRHLPTSMP